MNKKWLMDEGFSKEEAKVIEAYSKQGRLSPAKRKSVESVRNLFRSISWLTALVVIVYFLSML